MSSDGPPRGSHISPIGFNGGVRLCRLFPSDGAENGSNGVLSGIRSGRLPMGLRRRVVPTALVEPSRCQLGELGVLPGSLCGVAFGAGEKLLRNSATVSDHSSMSPPSVFLVVLPGVGLPPLLETRIGLSFLPSLRFVSRGGRGRVFPYRFLFTGFYIRRFGCRLLHLIRCGTLHFIRCRILHLSGAVRCRFLHLIRCRSLHLRCEPEVEPEAA
jgi:hypothetical protein